MKNIIIAVLVGTACTGIMMLVSLFLNKEKWNDLKIKNEFCIKEYGFSFKNDEYFLIYCGNKVYLMKCMMAVGNRFNNKGEMYEKIKEKSK